MTIIDPSFTWLGNAPDGDQMLANIAAAGRVCYQSESKSDDAAFVRKRIRQGHESILEHEKISVRIICDRGVSHEIVRHRIASYAQESTRYCNYGSDKFNNEITVISPFSAMILKRPDSSSPINIGEWYDTWVDSVVEAENKYLELIELGCPPEIARGVLPTSLKTEIVVTMNLREWRHFFNLRASGKTGKPHPQMLELTIPLLNELKNRVPVVFDDIKPEFKIGLDLGE